MRNGKHAWNLLVIPLLTIAAQGGTIKGTIVYEGPVPKLRPIKMEADPSCHALHDTPVFPETLVLGEGRALANVFIRVMNPPPQKYPTPDESVEISQKGCMYSPHVLGVMVGQRVNFVKSDGILHCPNTFASKQKDFSMAVPKFKKVVTKVFAEEEPMFSIKCDVHPWMQAWISVMSHPFFATTGKEGTYEIKGLPEGEYVTEVWHELLKTQTRQVKISALNDVQVADFTYQHASLRKQATK